MADVSVENNDAPVVEKEVEEVAAPKVTEEDAEEKEKVAVENGSEETTENGSDDKEEDEKETPNGMKTAISDALKRKPDETEEKTVEEVATPEKKAKLDESAKEPEVKDTETEVTA